MDLTGRKYWKLGANHTFELPSPFHQSRITPTMKNKEVRMTAHHRGATYAASPMQDARTALSEARP
ncbi:hypothetical protein CVV68_08825 [Arthrobacter livingstonensis]|uniref:Uncharacterized protein n=1 Tax=Arthrobacter livingstonensis TaxID=670078 RepID=A0A2V5LKV4_9MICC|nr:hypothetical protein CVV68_08825 [Arthrobacter livingstonensis]